MVGAPEDEMGKVLVNPEKCRVLGKWHPWLLALV